MDWFILLTLNPLFPILFPLYLIYRPPRILVRWLQKKFPDVLFYCRATEKIVALTLDDAPSSFTADILSVLAKYDAKATFFCIGSQMEGQEAVLREIVLAGHELGNHAMFDEPSFKLRSEVLSQQIMSVDSMICTVYESLHLLPPPKYFRPGSGFFNATMRDLVKSIGYRIILGDVYPHDPQIHKPKLNAWHVVTMVKEGSIIIVHDRRNYTAETLEKILKNLKKAGYALVTVTELLTRTAQLQSAEEPRVS